MHDLWDEGYACGTDGMSWPAVVMGRFLKDWERRALAAGWRAGLRDAAAYRQDMAADVFAAVGGDDLPY